MTRLSRPIPGAFSGTKRDALASGLYSPAAAFAPSTIGFGGDTFSDQYTVAVFSRVRNILAGDDLLGYVFTWQAENASINAEVTTWLALFFLDTSKPQAVLRRVPGTYATTTWPLAATTTHGRAELMTVPKPVSLDPNRVYLVGVMQEGAGAWVTSPGILGADLGPAGLSTAIDVTPVLVEASGANVLQQDVVSTALLSGGTAKCPGIGLATSRIKVRAAGGAEAFLF